MKFTVFILSILINIGLWASESGDHSPIASKPHSSAVYTSVIYKDLHGWNLKLSFSTPGFLEGLRAFNNDKKLLLNYSDSIGNKITQYVKAHVSIIINKHFKVSLSNYQAIISNHAVEFHFKLNNIPNNPIYWDVTIDACKENIDRVANTLLIKSGGKSSVFKLTTANHFHMKVMKDSKGGYKELKK